MSDLTHSPSTQPTLPKCHLKELPAELRTTIFEYALTEEQPLAICTDPRWSCPSARKVFHALIPSNPSAKRIHYAKYADDIHCKAFWLIWIASLEERPAVPALALTCWQFLAEAMEVFYAENVFVLGEVYAREWEQVLFETARRLGDLAGQRDLLKVKRVRIHVENCDNESVPSTEDAGKVLISYDVVAGGVKLEMKGMLEEFCLCVVHTFAAQFEGQDCVEEFVKGFHERFYRSLENLGRCGIRLDETCDECGRVKWETWEMMCRRTGREMFLEPAEEPFVQEEPAREEKEMRQTDIRTYYSSLAER